MRYLPESRLGDFLDALQADYDVYAPFGTETGAFWGAVAGHSGAATAAGVRAVDPLKSFFFGPRECVAEGFEDVLPGSGKRAVCVVGAKACDLQGLGILDAAFLGEEPEDPFYASWRRDTLIVSADCTEALDTCFCLAMGGEPHPVEGYDINLAACGGGFIAEAGSDRGRAVFDRCSRILQDWTGRQHDEVKERRQRVREMVLENVRRENIPEAANCRGAVAGAWDDPVWREEAERCVECGACNVICPTCHCFVLRDVPPDDRPRRLRCWDSCLLKDFARVAGGANPRDRLWMRLRNRLDKKFDFFPATTGEVACTGCGRCIACCPGRIDIRHILQRMASSVSRV